MRRTVQAAIALSLGAVLLFGATPDVQAQTLGSIGVHFPSSREDSGLLFDEIAGVVPQGYWNSADGGGDGASNASGDTSTIVLPFPGVLTDDSGAPTGATVEWTSNGTWNTSNGVATPDAKLMNGYIDAFDSGIGPVPPGVTVTLSNIPYALYDAIVYVGTDGNNRQGDLTDGTTTYHYLTASNDPNGGGGFDPLTDYIPVISTDPNNRLPGNYAVFFGLTDSTFSASIFDHTVDNNNGIHAVQIINVPEPATIALLALGGAAGLRRSRRRTRA